MNGALIKINWKVVLAFGAIYIIWGTTYLAIRIGVEYIPPFIMASARYIIAGVLLLLYCTINKELVFSKTAVNNILLGAFMLTLGQGVLFWAEKYVPSGLTAVYVSTLPICYILMDKRQWKHYFNSRLTLFSIVLGLVGVVVLFKSQSGISKQHSSGMTIIASLTIIISCLCWALGSLYYKYSHTAGSLFRNVGWQLIGGAAACLIVSLLTNEWAGFKFETVTTTAMLAVLYLAIAGSIIAFTASYWLLARRPAPIVGTYAYVNPVIAVLLGCFLAKETITITQVGGMIIILIAAYLANSVKFKTAA